MNRVIHVPYTYAPDPGGGTEKYVSDLARSLDECGWASLVVAPGSTSAAYEIEGRPVERFAGSPGSLPLEQLYGAGDPAAAAAFLEIVDRVRPEIVHMHSFTASASILLVRGLKQRGIPLVFTYHTPTVSCQRGSLLEWGTRDCDGVVKVARCSRCALNGYGLAKGAAWLLGSLPPAIGKGLGRAGLQGGAWTALRMTALAERRRGAFAELLAGADAVVAPSEWVRALLLANGIEGRKVLLSRQGVEPGTAKPAARAGLRASRLRAAFFGRLDPSKGAHLLIDAVRSLPEAALELDLHGIVQSDSDRSYREELEAAARGDPRVRFLEPVPAARMMDTIAQYDLVLVPSLVKETGPLVLIEAFAAGVPVAGSKLGGIQERIRHGVDGLLVAPMLSAWMELLSLLAASPEQVSALRKGVVPPRTMRMVAEEMAQLYATLAPR